MANQDDLRLESQILGCIYGNCIGDAIGLLTEFMTKEDAKRCYGRERNLMLEYADKVSDKHRDCWLNGDWTDDSDQMILIMDSIIDSPEYTQAKKVNFVDFAERLKVWASHGFPELGDRCGFGLGHTTNLVLNHKQYLSNPHQAAKDAWDRTGQFAAPNGAVMRTSILGIYNYKDLKSVHRNCKDIAKVTHADPRCVASCVAVCSAIAFMLQRQQEHLTSTGDLDLEKIIRDSYTEAAAVFENEKDEKKRADELWKYMNARTLESLELDEPGKIGYTYKSLGAGFWALRHRDFRSALTSVTMEAGDADTNGAVAGALLGCKLGFQGLPDTWVDKLFHRQWLDNKIYQFMDKAMPELKMQLICYDKKYKPIITLTPKQAKRKEKEMRSEAQETQAENLKQHQTPVNTSTEQSMVENGSNVNSAAEDTKNKLNNTGMGNREHEACTNTQDNNTEVERQRSEHPYNVERQNRDHVAGVQQRDYGHVAGVFESRESHGRQKDPAHGSVAQFKNPAHGSVGQSRDHVTGGAQKGQNQGSSAEYRSEYKSQYSNPHHSAPQQRANQLQGVKGQGHPHDTRSQGHQNDVRDQDHSKDVRGHPHEARGHSHQHDERAKNKFSTK